MRSTLRRPVRLATLLASAGVVAACAEPLPGTPVAREELCTEIVRIVCDADRECFPESARTDCVEIQETSCGEIVQPLVDDPRLGYDEERAGAFIHGLEEQAEACWSAPIDYDRFLSVFTGTGRVGADCTPSALDLSSLRTSALSCSNDAACRIHLRADGSPEGVCEARSDGDCSHPLDCGAGSFCSLSSAWRPGVWGECRPLRTDGWACSSDLECASHHCDGTCGSRPVIEQPLVVEYAEIIQNDEPLAFLRYDSPSARFSDASGNSNPVTLMGTVDHADEGVSELDEGGSLELPGDGYAVLRAMDELDGADAMSIELWFRRSSLEGTSPLIELYDGENRGTHIWNHDTGGKVYTNVITLVPEGEMEGMPVSNTIMSADGVVHVDTWHHVVLTYDGQRARLYLDATLIGETTLQGELPLDGDIHVGHVPAFGESAERFFTGRIDEVAVYDEALELDVIRAHRAVGMAGEQVNGFPLFDWLSR